MTRKEFKVVCRERRLCWGGLMLEYMTPHVMRTFARAGFEWVWIDNEHGYHSFESIVHVTRAAEDLGVVPIVRVAQGDYPLIARALDMAIGGVIIPRVETPEQVRKIIDCAKYPPIGKRGFGMRPAIFGKRKMSMAERIADQNEGRFLIVQLESPRALENLEKMIEVAQGQLDGVFFGPSDYQVAIGKPDHPDIPELVDAAHYLTSTCAKHNLSNGVPATNPENAQRWVDFGFNLITYKSDDQFMVDGACDGYDEVRPIKISAAAKKP